MGRGTGVAKFLRSPGRWEEGSTKGKWPQQNPLGICFLIWKTWIIMPVRSPHMGPGM